MPCCGRAKAVLRARFRTTVMPPPMTELTAFTAIVRGARSGDVESVDMLGLYRPNMGEVGGAIRRPNIETNRRRLNDPMVCRNLAPFWIERGNSAESEVPHALRRLCTSKFQCDVPTSYAAGVGTMDRQQFAHLALSKARGAALYPHKYRRNLEDPWAHDALRPRNSR